MAMSGTASIIITGIGAVSPAGWGLPALHQAVAAGQALPVAALARPGWPDGLRVRKVPAPNPRPTFLAHPRLRRSSPVSQFAAAAAIEALGGQLAGGWGDQLGIVFCTEAGTMNYSRRFLEEARRDPATASPLIFPETVINAPAGHLAALLESTGPAYTLMGDSGAYVQGLAVAAHWLLEERVEACLVIGAEELDWLPAAGFRIFHHANIMSEGAGALCLRRGRPADGPSLEAVSDSFNYSRGMDCRAAMRALRQQLGWTVGPEALLCDSQLGLPNRDRPEQAVWADWPGMRCSPKRLLGEAMVAGAAWQSVVAAKAVRDKQAERAVVSVAGCSQQAIGAVFRA
jgi:hypothetical protein